MRIVKHGTVVFTKQEVKIEGWIVEPEFSDPGDATKEQMLLEVVIPWAQQKLNDAIMQNLRRISNEKKAQNPTEAS